MIIQEKIGLGPTIPCVPLIVYWTRKERKLLLESQT